MIAAIEGLLEQRGPDWAIIKIGGVSLQVYLPNPTMNQLGAVGDKVELCTYLHWKEDNIALYGFSSQQDLDLFRLLISVNSVGPRLALTILSGISSDQLTLAIGSGNVDLLTQVPGVGRKTASRLVVELKTKLGKEQAGIVSYLTEDNSEVTAALINLGYSAAEAARAVAELPQSSDLSLEDKVRLALRHGVG